MQFVLACCLLSRSFLICLKHRKRLNLGWIVLLKAIKKTFNLAWCYSAFVSEQNPERNSLVVKCAFSSMAYDVLTDWHGISVENKNRLEDILRELVSDNEVEIAIKLYEKEHGATLECHGLDRGVDALEFILLVCNERLDEYDIKVAGYALQAIDDLLDYEEDLRNQDMNFIMSSERDLILSCLPNWYCSLPVKLWCDRSFAFRIAYDRSVEKAALLNNRFGVNVTLRCPDHEVNNYDPLEYGRGGNSSAITVDK